MSVLVKGMDMPENCGECRMDTEIGCCSAMPDNFGGYTDDRKRPDWCPLVELPEKHGRLIDADAFNLRVRLAVGSVEDELSEEFMDGVLTVLRMMKTAKTVIEAEGVDE